MKRGPYNGKRVRSVLRALVHFKQSGVKTVPACDIIARMYEEGYDGSRTNARNVLAYHTKKLGIKKTPGSGRGGPCQYHFK